MQTSLLFVYFLWSFILNFQSVQCYIQIRKSDLKGAISLRKMYYNKQFKIAFCPIQKVASSSWAQLFLRMTGDRFWFEPPWHKDIPSFSQLKIEEIDEIMNDETWTKVVLFRDPSIRLLSSYLYLIDNPQQVSMYRNNLLKYTNHTTWDDFLYAVLEKNYQNVHWRPQVLELSNKTPPPHHMTLTHVSQTDYCGLRKFYKLFNFIGNLETISTYGPQLLKSLGIWEEYGQNEWSLTKVIKKPRGSKPNGDSSRYQFQYPPEYNQSDCMFCKIFSSHKTNSTNSTILKYLSRSAWEKIQSSKFYQHDYEMFALLNHTATIHSQGLERLTKHIWTSRTNVLNSQLYSQYPPPIVDE